MKAVFSLWMNRALRTASSMQIIEGLTDAEIAEAHRSADVFAEVQDMTAPLGALLSFFHALDWLELNTRANKLLLQAFLSGVFCDPVQIAIGEEGDAVPQPDAGNAQHRFVGDNANTLAR